jgi:selenocysteine lyase/cysteine desulfurase
MNKRTFLKSAAVTTAGLQLGLSSFAAMFETKKNTDAITLASDDAFWKSIRDQYILKSEYINLENGYYCITPQPIIEKFIENVRYVNREGAFYMRNFQFDNKKKITTKLAALVGCPADQLAITRNATESLDLVIAGQEWKSGDEAVMALQDYGAMLDMFEQVSKRCGVVLKKVSIPNHPVSDEEIVSLYEKAITPKTKLLMVCHMINITGQILPIRKICDMAHRKGVEVMVDGAHAVAHFEFKISDFDCDYYGSSLHKWLSVPLGAGLLYVKKDKIAKLWPLLGDGNTNLSDISRINHTGTHPVHTDLTISDAIDYHHMIGSEKKEKRLRYLQLYWTSKVRNIKKMLWNCERWHRRHPARRSCKKTDG